MAAKAVRVLIIDESSFFKDNIVSALAQDPGIEVIATVEDPYKARNLVLQFSPDVIALDISSRKTREIEFLKHLLPEYPLPVVVIGSAAGAVFDALEAGAVDFISRPALKTEHDMRQFLAQMSVKIKIASIAKVDIATRKQKQQPAQKIYNVKAGQGSLIAIGASTGGTEAILSVLKQLGDDMSGIVIVQHMPAGFTKVYAERLDTLCRMKVREAKDNDKILPGTALVAPGGLQMTVEQQGGGLTVECKTGEKVSGHCPSVDNLFDSVAKLKGINSLGIILTGMGSDGANGLLAMKRNGSETIGQDKKSSVVYGMPEVAYSIGAVNFQLPLELIPRKIYEWQNSLTL